MCCSPAAGPSIVSRLTTGWPALALLIAVKLLSGMLDRHAAGTIPLPVPAVVPSAPVGHLPRRNTYQAKSSRASGWSADQRDRLQTLSPVREHRVPVREIVSVNGVQLFVRRFGDPALPMLVVIHGGPTWDHTYLLPAADELADSAHVVMFDLRGCGRSSRTPPVGNLPVTALQPDYLADDTAALVRQLGAGRADILGFSYGGMIAMRVVEQHPQAVRSVILASTTAYQDFQDELEASADYHERGALCSEVGLGNPDVSSPDAPDGALSRAMAFGGAPRDIWQLARLDEWHQVLERVRFSSDWNQPYAAGLLRPAAPDDPPRILGEWGGPVLILHGAREMGFPIGVARRLHAEVQASTLVEVPEAAHMAHFDNPQVWLGAIRDFLRTR
jgi:pimeloyl-ACP methyl ester carboxylesterase